MYQPDTKAKPQARPVAPGGILPDRNGTHEQKQAWMQQRQAQGRNARLRGPRIERVLAEVCKQFEVTRGELLSKSRSHAIAQSRGQACRELRKQLNLSYPEIARALNLHEHSSVMYHCHKEEAQQAATPDPDREPVVIRSAWDPCMNCGATRGDAYEVQMGMLCPQSEDLMHHFGEGVE
jgi:hypothetical protein